MTLFPFPIWTELLLSDLEVDLDGVTEELLNRECDLKLKPQV